MDFRRVLNIGLWVVSLGLIGLMMGFVAGSKKELTCSKVNVIIQDKQTNFFLTEENVLELINDRGDSLIGQPFSSIDVKSMERMLENVSCVESAEVHSTINGKLIIKIRQRSPLFRVVPKEGEGYYIDMSGKLMQLSNSYSPRILLVSGNIQSTFAAYHEYNLNQLPDEILEETLLDNIYDLVRYIKADVFWNSQIAQIYVNDNREIVLIPRVGDHIILLGTTDHLERKLKKLLIFYEQGLKQIGWNKYNLIDLKYVDQIVCTIKEES